MPLSLVDLAMRFLPADVIAKIAVSLNSDPATVTRAAANLIPGTFKGIGVLAAKLDGAHQVADVLSNYDLGDLGEMTGKIGAPDQDNAIAQGAKLSRHLMNASDRDALIAATTASSGLDPAQSEKLLSLLTPIVAGTLVEQRLKNDLDTVGLARLLTADPSGPLAEAPAEVAAVLAPARPVTLQSVIADLKPAAGTAREIPFSAIPRPTRAIPEVAKIQERPAALPKPRVAPEKTIPVARVTTIGRPKRDDDWDDDARAVPQARTATSLTKVAVEDTDVEMAPVRRSGHYLARFGWLLPLILLVLAGSWWLKTLLDEPDEVVMAAPPQATASAASVVKQVAPIPQIAANSERPAAMPEAAAAAKPEAVVAVPRPPGEPAAVLPQVAAADTSSVASNAARDAELARKAAEDAAAEKIAREAELGRKAAADAVAAKQARDAELVRRVAADADAEARRQALAREAEAKVAADAANARRAAANAAPTPVPATTVTMAVCQKTVAELSSANRIRFEFASPRITRASSPALSAMVVAIKFCPPARIRVEGHTDTDGHFDRNQRLSENRARAVVSYLVKAGVDPKRITFAGYGQTRPRVPNTSDANKQLNRRIEVSVEAG